MSAASAGSRRARRGRRPLTSIVVAASLASMEARAQVGDSLASASVELYPYARNTDDPRMQVRLQIYRANVGLPIRLSQQTMLLAGLSYEQLNVDLRGDTSAGAPTFRTPAASFGVVQRVGSRFTVIAIAGAGLASDFSDPVSSDDLLLSATGIFIYKVSDALSLGAGVVFDRRTGSPTPLPAMSVNWRISHDVRLRGFVPARLDAELRASRWLTGGIRAAFNGNRYQLGEAKYGISDQQIAYSTLTVGPKLTFSASDWIHLDLYATTAVYRRYDIRQDQEDAGGLSLAPAVAWGVRFWFGPALWEPPKW